MQHAQSIGAVNDAARPVDWHRETARQHPAGRRICNSIGICPLSITGTRAQRPQNRKSCPTSAVCAAPHTLSTVSTRTQKTPRFASERLFSVVLHPESPERNTLSACIRNRRVRTPCRRAFACAGFERNASMHSESPERNAMSVCIRICRSRTERPQARQDRLRREATRWPAGWERCTRERHFHGQGRRAPWHRCRTASCATPASRRCPLPPAAPR